MFVYKRVLRRRPLALQNSRNRVFTEKEFFSRWNGLRWNEWMRLFSRQWRWTMMDSDWWRLKGEAAQRMIISPVVFKFHLQSWKLSLSLFLSLSFSFSFYLFLLLPLSHLLFLSFTIFYSLALSLHCKLHFLPVSHTHSHLLLFLSRPLTPTLF